MQTPVDPWHGWTESSVATGHIPDLIEAPVMNETITGTQFFQDMGMYKFEQITAPQLVESFVANPSVEILDVPPDVADVIEKEFVFCLQESIAAIPDIIQSFRGGASIDEICEKYDFDGRVVEAIIRLAFRIRVLRGK